MFIDDLIRQILIDRAVTVGFAWVYDQFKDVIRRRTQKNTYQENIRLLRELGDLTPRTINKLVNNVARQSNVVATPSQIEELKRLLINLSQNASFITTVGRPTSSYFRCEYLLEQLLSNLRVWRKRGERVGVGSDWILDTYLGSGAYGEVWTGFNSQNPDIKWAREHPHVFKFFTDEHAKEWIRQETASLFQFQKKLSDGHANIIKFLNIHVSDQTYPYLEFEYAGGGSLEQWMQEDNSVRVKIDKSQIIRGLAEGLAAAHDAGVSHRDLKPANIVLTEGHNPTAKITDFGLAHVRPEGNVSSSMQSQAAIAGTFIYLPPEAQRSFAACDLDYYKQDMFAFGVIWYQLYIGELERPPYNFAQQLSERGVDSKSIELISRCLAHPNDRFANAVEFLEHLTDLVPPDWQPPQGCFNVEPLFREYLALSQG